MLECWKKQAPRNLYSFDLSTRFEICAMTLCGGIGAFMRNIVSLFQPFKSHTNPCRNFPELKRCRLVEKLTRQPLRRGLDRTTAVVLLHTIRFLLADSFRVPRIASRELIVLRSVCLEGRKGLLRHFLDRSCVHLSFIWHAAWNERTNDNCGEECGCILPSLQRPLSLRV